MNCQDRALGSKVDTLSLTDLFHQLEKLVVVEVEEDRKQTVVPQVEEAVCDAHGSEDNNLSQSDLLGQIKEHAVLVIDEEQNVVGKVEKLILLYGQSGGQEGGAQDKTKITFNIFFT